MTGAVAGAPSFGDRYAVVHDVAGPRVRLGVVWTLLVLAAFVVGSGAVAVVFGATAAIGALQAVGRWRLPNRFVGQVVSAAGAFAIVMSATVGLRAVGLTVIAAAVGAVVVPAVLVPGRAAGTGPAVPSATVMVAAAGPVLGPALAGGLAGAAVVQVDREDAVAFLFLLAAVSTYDAGAFLCGAGYPSRVVGPGAGVIGVLAVTGSMYLAEPPPFEGAETLVAGAVLAAACPLGQVLGSWLLPEPSARAPGLRRLDAWLVAAPAFLAVVWWATG